MGSEEYWPLRKRAEDLLHVLVTFHRKVPQPPSPLPEFRAYRGRQTDWLEHPSIPAYRNRVAMQLEDVGTMRARGMVRLTGDQPEDKRFVLTAEGFAFHDAHCTRAGH